MIPMSPGTETHVTRDLDIRPARRTGGVPGVAGRELVTRAKGFARPAPGNLGIRHADYYFAAQGQGWCFFDPDGADDRPVLVDRAGHGSHRRCRGRPIGPFSALPGGPPG